MKNAAEYRKKIRELIKGAKAAAATPDDAADAVTVLLRSVLEADAPGKRAEKAMAAIREEFVDANELRVALPREVADCIGKDYPDARRKAEEIKEVLGSLFKEVGEVRLDFLAELPRRELRRRLRELGMSPYAAACVAMFCFDVPAIPVDRLLAGCLEINGYVAPGSTVREVQSFLQRTIPQKQSRAAHAFFRRYVRKHGRSFRRKLAAEARDRAKAEAEALAKVEAEAKAQAEKAAKARRRAKPRRPRKAAKAKKVASPGAAKEKPAAKAKAAPKRKPAARTKKKASRKRAKKASRKAGKTARRARRTRREK
jgi:endonuclease III